MLAAFFDPAALRTWWQTARSVTTARPLGIYAVEWEPTIEIDDLLGRLGGVFYGNVMEYQPGRELVIADAWWLPPDSGPIGPMSLAGAMRDGWTGLPAARPPERFRGHAAMAALLRGDRSGLVEVDGRAQTVRRSLGLTLRSHGCTDPG